jgi:hypothetical protein
MNARPKIDEIRIAADNDVGVDITETVDLFGDVEIMTATRPISNERATRRATPNGREAFVDACVEHNKRLWLSCVRAMKTAVRLRLLGCRVLSISAGPGGPRIEVDRPTVRLANTSGRMDAPLNDHFAPVIYGAHMKGVFVTWQARAALRRH